MPQTINSSQTVNKKRAHQWFNKLTFRKLLDTYKIQIYRTDLESYTRKWRGRTEDRSFTTTNPSSRTWTPLEINSLEKIPIPTLFFSNYFALQFFFSSRKTKLTNNYHSPPKKINTIQNKKEFYFSKIKIQDEISFETKNQLHWQVSSSKSVWSRACAHTPSFPSFSILNLFLHLVRK